MCECECESNGWFGLEQRARGQIKEKKNKVHKKTGTFVYLPKPMFDHPSPSPSLHAVGEGGERLGHLPAELKPTEH